MRGHARDMTRTRHASILSSVAESTSSLMCSIIGSAPSCEPSAAPADTLAVDASPLGTWPIFSRARPDAPRIAAFTCAVHTAVHTAVYTAVDGRAGICVIVRQSETAPRTAPHTHTIGRVCFCVSAVRVGRECVAAVCNSECACGDICAV